MHSKKLLEEMRAIVGDEFASILPADLEQHSHDQSFHQAHLPTIVVWPDSADQTSAIIDYANRTKVPVTPWGAGTSLEGNPTPVHAGIVLDLSRMNQIIKLRLDDFMVTVQAGMRYKDMNAQIARHGVFFAPDPGANATIGGMIANNAAGTRTPKYGATKDNIIQLEVVTPTGKIIQTGSLSHKSSSGYDLAHLFVGSEGTLGIITQATLHLAPLPEYFSAAVASFESNQAATRTVSAIMGSGIVPAALELLDTATVRTLNTAEEFSLIEQPTLLMEFHSATQAALQAELDIVQTLCQEENCTHLESGMGRQERDRLWKVRHQTYEILVRNNPGKSFLIVDACAPVSRYPELVTAAETAFKQVGLQGYIVGHAGDGNLHALIPYTEGDAQSYQIANRANNAMVDAAIQLEGTATGEHGVGIGKRKFMLQEHGSSLAVMRAIKNALDPNGILNPGKIFPDLSGKVEGGGKF